MGVGVGEFVGAGVAVGVCVVDGPVVGVGVGDCVGDIVSDDGVGLTVGTVVGVAVGADDVWLAGPWWEAISPTPTAVNKPAVQKRANTTMNFELFMLMFNISSILLLTRLYVRIKT